MNDPTQLASQSAGFDCGQVSLSLPEIGSLASRAARGAGFGWGLAEEAGMAAQWLARAGLDWPTAFLSCLEGDKGVDFRPRPGAWEADGPACGLRIGVALSDFATLPEGPARVLSLGKVLNALLVVPFVSQAALKVATPLRLEMDGIPVAWISGDALVPAAGGIPVLPLCDLRVVRAADNFPPAGRDPVGDQNFPIPAALWGRLDRLALGMTVPATEQSLSGAGAGVSDND
ncbi:DUF3726 domain-containing protein [Ruegeria marina]|uniref:DUF3726 domain-containing protein n=1 Tax=Ruegeria marina TaxID=639004 RepID=A0A1G6WUL2_9RHOB|nr:DUF3726 domain-containing protein [Ruegeria marina]SDD69504.1 Protein of unknown function [Ruegeria marina]